MKKIHRYNKNWLPFDDFLSLNSDKNFDHYGNIDRTYIYFTIFFRYRIRFVYYKLPYLTDNKITIHSGRNLRYPKFLEFIILKCKILNNIFSYKSNQQQMLTINEIKEKYNYTFYKKQDRLDKIKKVLYEKN